MYYAATALDSGHQWEWCWLHEMFVSVFVVKDNNLVYFSEKG